MTDTELPKIGAPATRALASIGVTRLEQVAVGMLPRSRASASALTKQCLIDCCTSRFGRFGRLHDMEHHSARTPTVDQLPGIDVSGVKIVGADPMQLAALRRRRLDHGGNAVEAFVDRDGGWPLRCCLVDSTAGDLLAIVAWSPFPWDGPYAESGPVVIHATLCNGRTGTGLPAQFLTRPQIVRPYGHDHRIAYDHIVVVEPDGSLPDVLADVLARPSVEFVHVRNVRSGCWSFVAVRNGASDTA